jgi:tyrosine phenol-lyase
MPAPRNYYHLESTVQKYYGYKFLVPTHQGRGAEHLISRILIKPGDTIPGNMYFTTTRQHQELAGGTFVDVIIDEAHQSQTLHPFKGNVDLRQAGKFDPKSGGRKNPLHICCSDGQYGGWPTFVNGKFTRNPCS